MNEGTCGGFGGLAPPLAGSAAWGNPEQAEPESSCPPQDTMHGRFSGLLSASPLNKLLLVLENAL